MKQIFELVSKLEFIVGFVIGLVGNFIASAIWEWVKENRRAAKQHKFIQQLNESMEHYVDFAPLNDIEVANRRADVKATVIQSSVKIFNKTVPPFESFRPETTTYPPINCKWCHQMHEARAGSKGTCKNCPLPLDLWIASQSVPRITSGG